MNKNFKNFFLYGAVAALSAGAFTSCNDDDDYETRISVLETAVSDLQTQLNKALTVGASVTNVKEDNGAYEITLSDGQVINIKPSTTTGVGGGGSDVTVTVTDTQAVITVNGTEYRLPLGSAVSSLIYSPEFADGEVLINGTDGGIAKFLACPGLDNLDGAVFTIAESHELKSRALGEGDFKVSKAELDGGLVAVTINCINGDLTGTKHAACVQMKYRGTVIGSNYFTINVGSGFSFSSEALDPAITVEGATVADGVYTLPVDAGVLSGTFNLAAAFKNVPDGATYQVAATGKQPGGAAQEKRDLIASSLKPDGTFEWTGRPGTSFNDNEEQKGFLVNVVKDDVVIAKTYITINDPLAGVDISFPNDLRSQHMEYGEPNEDHSEGAPLHLHKGAQRVNFVEIMIKHQLALGHGSAWDFCDALANYANDYVYATETALVMSDDVKKYCTHSAGVKWFNVQTSVVSSQRRNWGMSEEELKAAAGGECNGEIVGGWDGISGEDMANLGFSITPDGFIETTDAFPGVGLRVGMGVELEYDYGKLTIADNCLAFLFFGRRSLDEGVTDVAAR